MSVLHPIVAVTGSSGAGTSTVRVAFEHMFRRMNVNSAFIEGDSFHAYDREAMREQMHRASVRG
ncbi:MAG TPA: phosphoribulokinase, partial [Gammaproteobacteria bacterium]|nr:phosphoribulokinase [Gammaproteobacteria bacterium]